MLESTISFEEFSLLMSVIQMQATDESRDKKMHDLYQNIVSLDKEERLRVLNGILDKASPSILRIYNLL